MEARNPVPALVVALATLALLASDWQPALHGAPLLLLLTGAAVQIDRELANALANRRLYPSASTMNFLTAIVIVHLAYFRVPDGSSLLELIGTALVAMLVLVIVAAVGNDVKVNGPRAAVRDLLLTLLIPLIVGGGLGAALYLQVFPDLPRVSAGGSQAVAVLAAAGWLGLLAGRLVERPGAGYLGLTPAGLAARLGATALATLVGWLALKPLGPRTAGAALAVGVVAGVALALGYLVVRKLALACEVVSFRHRLPHQVELLQQPYERHFTGGLTDYVGPLTFLAPAVLALLRWGLS